MPGDPDECRLNSERCAQLARAAVSSECPALLVLAETWKRLAAEFEADELLPPGASRTALRVGAL